MRESARNLSFMGDFSFYAAQCAKASAPQSPDEAQNYRMMKFE